MGTIIICPFKHCKKIRKQNNCCQEQAINLEQIIIDDKYYLVCSSFATKVNKGDYDHD